jgi:outer membrane immunogenic protein
MNRISVTTSVMLLGLLASPLAANAADLQAQMPVKAPPYIAPEYDWNGFYAGINGGGGWGTSRTDLGGRFGTSGGVVGGTAGYNAQIGRWVLGLEGDIDWSNVSGSTTSLGCAAGCSVQNNWLGTARGRAGYAFGSWLPYVTGGLAVGGVNATAAGFNGQTNTQLGWVAGAGVEYGIGGGWSAKLEYLRANLGRFDCGLNCGGTAPDNVNFHDNLIRGGINLHF